MTKFPKISRREFAASAGLAVASLPVLAQSPNRTPAQDDEKQAAVASGSRRRAIAEFDTPIETEPAFVFKA
jgi:hypothetical protein